MISSQNIDGHYSQDIEYARDIGDDFDFVLYTSTLSYTHNLRPASLLFIYLFF